MEFNWEEKTSVFKDITYELDVLRYINARVYYNRIDGDYGYKYGIGKFTSNNTYKTLEEVKQAVEYAITIQINKIR